jgi:hypothetical protein
VGHKDAFGQFVTTAFAGNGSDCVFSGFEKGVGNVRSNCASSLSVFVNLTVYMMLEDRFAYTDNGNFFNGVLEADRLIFGVLGHYGPVGRIMWSSRL